MTVRIIQKKEIQRKGISTLLVLAMLLLMLPISAFAAVSGNSDIADHWAQPAIEKWSAMGIVKGSDGRFRPDAPITRGELAVIIDRIMKYQTASKNNFTDLGEEFYTPAVLKTNAAGIMKGDGVKIRPNDKITREEAVVMIGRALGLTEKTGFAVFSDRAAISKWAAGYVNSAADKGYINGYNGLFQPKSTITRAEVVTILDNAITGLYTEAKEYSTEVNGNAIVNASGAVLKNMKITGDLIISEGVGNGNVTLNNVTVTGKTIIRGGGPNSILITGGSRVTSLVILKTDTGKIRVVTSNKAVVDIVYVNDGNDDIILTGAFKNVTVAADAKVSAVSAEIQSLNITNGSATVNIDKSSKVSAITIANAAAGTSLSIAGEVGTLTVDSKATVSNKGTIAKAIINTDDFNITGTAPVKTEFGIAVTNPPKTTGTTTTSGGTGGGNTGGNPPTSTTIAVTGITLNKTAMTLNVGDAPVTLVASVTPAGATNKIVTWTSSNTTIATVSAQGAVTPVATGSTTITAKTADGSYSATCKINVNIAAVKSGTKTSTNAAIGTYSYVNVTGLKPFVFMPTGAGSTSSAAFTNVTNLMDTYGKSNNIVVAINSGIFYNAGTPTQYCFNYKEPDGVVISNGVVLKSTESIDHTGCDILVFDENGNVGWTDYYADADALVDGTGYYYDIHGNKVTGKKIVSAVTGFVPILIDGNSVYNPGDKALNGYHNFVGHYSGPAVRQIFGVKADGTYGILTDSTTWSLATAAEAAKAEGFVFAYNLDGGGSAETVLATVSGDNYSYQTFVPQSRGNRPLPTYIVFTANNVTPISATASTISATTTPSGATFTCGVTLGAITQNLEVTEKFSNANGKTSTRKLYSRQGVDMSQTLTHTIIGGSTTFAGCTVKKVDNNVPNGTLYFTKNDTDPDTIRCVSNNQNTRQGGKYYDYSKGYTLSTTDDLNTPGEKTITVSYVPGDGLAPLTTTFKITVANPALADLALNKTAMALAVGGVNGTLKATVNGTTCPGVTWTSSNPGTATVSNGTVTPVATGTTTITATAAGGKSATCQVTVNTEAVVSGFGADATNGITYSAITVSGLTPYVFTPVLTGTGKAADFQNVTGMMNTYGKSNNIVAAFNSGIFYNVGSATQYCFNYKEPDGVTISNGVVLKSTESIDHTQSDILVFDEDGNVGWTDYYADADALVAGTGYYYDIHGKKVTGKKIVSAVTGFVPIVIDGKSVYDPIDTALNGFHNYVGHYMGQKTARTIFGVKADGSCCILTNQRVFYPAKGWNMQDAANIAVAEGFVFAYNLDGGGSSEAVLATGSGDSYTVKTVYPQGTGLRQLPTYIVFTASNVAPVSATPSLISTTMSGATFTCGVTLGAITQKLTVTETFTAASGKTATRKVYSRQGVDMSQTLTHTLIGTTFGSSVTTVASAAVKDVDSNIPNGTLYYTKSNAEMENPSLKNNNNTRQSGSYYDYSKGYTLSTSDDLSTPGEKTITVSYIPGDGLAPLTTTFKITLSTP